MIRALPLIFFLSGAAALAFETVWFRQAGLALGNGVWASSIVLASFMGGLALGNAVVARRGREIRQPVRVYAILEVCIAVLGLGLVLLFPYLNGLLAPAFRPLAEYPFALNTARLGVSFSLMLIPAAAMGATLPVLVKGLHASGVSFGGSLGLLYGCNTLGGVAGALLAETVVIDAVGLRGTGAVAALANCVAAAVAWRIGADAPAGEAAPAPEPLSGRSLRLLGAAALAGGLLLALEVVWFRFTLMFTFGNSLVFACMLAVVLTGIGVGGLLGSLWLRLWGNRPMAVVLALVAGALAVWTYAAFVAPFGYDGKASQSLGTVLIRALWVMLPTSIASGMLFTAIGAELHREIGEETRAAGYLTLANTVGAMLGALAGGLMLLPGLGVERSLLVLGGAYGVIAWLLWPPRSELRSGPALWSVTWSAVALGTGVVAFPSGSLRERVINPGVRELEAEGYRIVAMREAVTETILYLEARRFGKPIAYGLRSNSHAMAGTGTRVRQYMKFFVHLPQALLPEAKSALLICFGCGSTAKALTDWKQLERIDVVDVSRDVLELSVIAHPDPAQHPLRDPRVRVHLEDGRFYLQTTQKTYDLITGEPPPPKAAGMVNLYSREYFQLVHDRLNPGGMATYWLPIVQFDDEDARAVVRAFCDVFKDCSLWTGSGPNWMLLGIKPGGTAPSAAAFRAPWSDPVVGPELRALGLELPEQLGARFLADGETLRALTSSSEPLVDDFPHRLRPILEGRLISDYTTLRDPEAGRERFLASSHVARLWPPELLQPSAKYFRWRDYAPRTMGDPAPPPVTPRLVLIDRVLRETSLRTLALWCMNSSVDEQRIVDEVAPTPSSDPVLRTKLGDRALADRDYPRAVGHFRVAHRLARGPASYRLVYALCLSGELKEAAQVAAEVKRSVPHPDGPLVWAFFERAFGLKVD